MWTWNEALLWMNVHLLQKWRGFPWSSETRDKSTRKLGDRGDLTNEQVEKWLDSIRPPQPNA